MQKKSFLQNLIFTAVMAFVMVYAMVCYNIAIEMGGMSNRIFLIAFHEIPIMWPIAIILEMFAFEKLAIKLAFRFVTPGKDNIYNTRHFHHDCMPYVPCNEPHRNTALRSSRFTGCRRMAPEAYTQFPYGSVLAGILRRTWSAQFL